MKERMEHLSIKWAKVSKKVYNERFENLGQLNAEDLEVRYTRVKAIYKESFIPFEQYFKQLPESQWEVTFLQQMTFLPEYKHLKVLAKNYKDHFLNRRAKADA